MMRLGHIPLLLLLAAGPCLRAQEADAPAAAASPREYRASLSVIDDATFYGKLKYPLPWTLNQVLVEPSGAVRYRKRWTASASLIGVTATYAATHAQFRVKEAYGGVSAGDFDLMVGRRLVRWGTGYAFTAAGVLDPPRVPTNPTDRLSLNQGRDMVKADWVHGPHAFTLAWSTAALAPAGSNLRNTTAFRYNVLVHGFDTSLIAGDDRGGDAFGALAFTRVFGQAWEVHGEASWREQGAVLLGAKYTTGAGITLMGEFYTPPNTAFYRDSQISPSAGRQHYGLLNVGKQRLRERPGWKEWDLSGSIVANINDRSFVAVADANRWFGKHFSAYAHLEAPRGGKGTDYGSAPYSTATSIGVRFQL